MQKSHDISKYSMAAAVLVMAAAALVIAGWALDVPALKSVSRGWVSMKFNTAISFLAAGGALYLAVAVKPSEWAGNLRAALACGLFVSSAAVLLQYLTGINLGIDELLIRDNTSDIASFAPGRMSPLTALAFLPAAIALFALRRGEGCATKRCCEPLAFIVFAIPFWSLITYLYLNPGTQLPPGLKPMALHTGLLLVLLAAGILFGNEGGILPTILLSRTTAGAMLKKTLPAVIVIPVLVGWFTLKGQNADFYGIGTTAALTSISAVLAMFLIVYLTIKPIYLLELQKGEAEEALRRNCAELETRVLERTAELTESNEKLRGEVAQRARAEKQQEELQGQLVQAQKLEAIGRLAGGVAHDFNNILTAISGYGGFLLKSLDDNPQAKADVNEIQLAAGRASALTRQLLIFSRKQAIELRTLELDPLVGNTLNMLKRLIGEDIELISKLRADAGALSADPGQLEQVVLNLVVNARDAMGAGGKITIETANVDLGEDYAQMHLQVDPGKYVMLAVHDTGRGMDKETLSHMFEPFFTTKAYGKGTGLGLSTVYGIVSQLKGGIYAYSEPGHGTTFKLYFPRESGKAPEAAAPQPAARAAGTETILVVEDDAGVRGFLLRALRQQGYTPLAACDANEALELCGKNKDALSLVITDLVLPGMNGLELGKRLRALCPRLKTIYTSGYSDVNAVQQGPAAEGERFLQKPISSDALLQAVRETLDEKAPASA